ncbi:AcrR family transcriptional regulator [Friedmanniella endophytica]|uniref:AcrR family transcriptional regulator n=1 Tax=Microlunatus kandeliicorticis TaxID=1759536 RepID=A0A7W3IVY6_9ACTN|nr:TetR/AcrR family transcriptional regulator [Microlunatus kandeliicorticis]MBA8796247.1 AcrR family transcriptional regulator [Microlunatus kandeliicorticis]
MGLRERKAARNRQRMTEVALALFLEHGYDETTMEQIAEAAEVGTSTLYRYFPTKDQLLLDPLVEAMDPTPRLRERPADEPLGEALGAALLAAAEAMAGDPRIADVRRLVDAAPVPRARLWDRMRTLRDDFEQAVGERAGRPADDLTVRMTAGAALDVFHLLDRARHDARADARDPVAALTAVLEALPGTRLELPRQPR